MRLMADCRGSGGCADVAGASAAAGHTAAPAPAPVSSFGFALISGQDSLTPAPGQPASRGQVAEAGAAVQMPQVLVQQPAILQRLHQNYDVAAVWAWRSEALGYACLQKVLQLSSRLMELGLLTEVLPTP